ncbi:MAG: 16S rRNA (cytosine(1402)-N(4))-methyltransferase RsmH [Candidatus Kapabacteria bacterium]|jgi:16S rRNA (cytosine1402-N4)-methyltransferase|nr:16S rRNA (cytosine(1402)-N(4))-methyltransferase RsmH [Candidatus Kapabacteria bacterium]
MSKKHKHSSKPRFIAPSETLLGADGTEIAAKNAGDYHVPVMLKECCDWLITDPEGTYIDGTLGGGGHSAEILRRLSANGHLIAFDEDPAAITRAMERFSDDLKTSSPRMTLSHTPFSFACSIKRDGKPQAQDFSGILLDLGVSSRQLDTGGIGLSYRVNSHLDMRFGSRDKPLASELIATTEQGELERILREFGEEPFAKVIARRIVDVRRVAPVLTTFDLRAIVEESVPPHLRQQALSRVFQAFRIAVNREFDVLEETLRGIVPRLRKGARIVVLSYHSLEDRIVKNVFQDLAKRTVPLDPNNPDDAEEAIKATTKRIEPKLTILTKKPLVPEAQEIIINPRARSAKLRVAEKFGE